MRPGPALERVESVRSIAKPAGALRTRNGRVSPSRRARNPGRVRAGTRSRSRLGWDCGVEGWPLPRATPECRSARVRADVDLALPGRARRDPGPAPRAVAVRALGAANRCGARPAALGASQSRSSRHGTFAISARVHRASTHPHRNEPAPGRRRRRALGMRDAPGVVVILPGASAVVHALAHPSSDHEVRPRRVRGVSRARKPASTLAVTIASTATPRSCPREESTDARQHLGGPLGLLVRGSRSL